MIDWVRLSPSGPYALYGVGRILDMEPADLRVLILELGGVLAPEGADRDKLGEWAAYLFEAARFRARGIRAPEEFIERYRTATDPRIGAMRRPWARRAEKARTAFAKLAERTAEGPTRTSAMGTAFAILDERGDMEIGALCKALFKAGKATNDKTASSYRSCWRRRNKEKGIEVKHGSKDSGPGPQGEAVQGDAQHRDRGRKRLDRAGEGAPVPRGGPQKGHAVGPRPAGRQEKVLKPRRQAR